MSLSRRAPWSPLLVLVLSACGAAPPPSEPGWEASCRIHQPCEQVSPPICDPEATDEPTLTGTLLLSAGTTELGCLDGTCCNVAEGGYNIHREDGRQLSLVRGAVAFDLTCEGDDSLACCTLDVERGAAVELRGREIDGRFEVDALCLVPATPERAPPTAEPSQGAEAVAREYLGRHLADGVETELVRRREGELWVFELAPSAAASQPRGAPTRVVVDGRDDSIPVWANPSWDERQATVAGEQPPRTAEEARAAALVFYDSVFGTPTPAAYGAGLTVEQQGELWLVRAPDHEARRALDLLTPSHFPERVLVDGRDGRLLGSGHD